MYELIIKQKRTYVFTDGKESLTTECIKLYFNTMENVTNAIKLMMLGSKSEVSFEIREIEEGQINED